MILGIISMTFAGFSMVVAVLVNRQLHRRPRVDYARIGQLEVELGLADPAPRPADAVLKQAYSVRGAHLYGQRSLVPKGYVVVERDGESFHVYTDGRTVKV